MFKKFILGVAIATITITGVGCTNTAKKQGDKLNVVTSINPIKELAKEIGGDKINLINIVPSGVEAHDFEPKPKDMEAIAKGDVFIYNGLDMESWVDGAIKNANNDKLNVIKASNEANIIEVKHDEKDHDEDKDKDKHEEKDHKHGKYDPHIWLSLKEAKVMAKNIVEGFKTKDKTNEEYYNNNYNKLIEKLDSIQKEYEDKFKEVKNKKFVTGHEAFAYLCRDFNLEQNSIEGVFAEGEGTTTRLKDLVKYCRDNNVKTIFAEEEASPKTSETLAKEVGAKVEKINTLESNGDYLNGMRENLEKIFNSLK